MTVFNCNARLKGTDSGRFIISRFAGLVLVLLYHAQPAWAINKTWVQGSGFWSSDGAWSPSGAPINGDFDVFIDEGDQTVLVTLNIDASINSLNLGSDDTLVIQGTFSSTTLTIDDGFTNPGRIRLTGFSVPSPRLSISTGALTNSATGVLHFQSTGSGTKFFAGDLVNNGTVTVDNNATFDMLNGTYTNNAQFSLNGGWTLNINAGGTLNQNAGTFNLNGTVSPGIGAFTVNGGTLDVAAEGRVIDGDFNYLGGTINNTLRLQNTTLTIGPAATNPATFLMNADNTLASNVNAGQTITVEAGFSAVTLTSADSFTNSGTIRLRSTSAPSPHLVVTSGTLTNSAGGLLDFDTGTSGDPVFSGNLINNGTVTVDHGTIFNKLNATYTNNGQFTVADGRTLSVTNGGTLNQNAGTFTLDGEVDLDSSSTFNVNGGTLNLGATALVDNGNFNYLGGTINGTAKLRNTTFTIGAGINPATFLLRDTNTLASSVGAGHTINVEATNVNSATLNSSSSFTNAGTINLTSTGVFSAFLHLTDPGNGTLTNTGTLRFQIGSGNGDRVFTGDLANSGTVAVDFDAIFNRLNGTHTNSGQFSVASGRTLAVSNGGTLGQNAGTFTLDGEVELDSGSTFNISGGTLNFGASALVEFGNFNYVGGTINGVAKLRHTIFTLGGGTNPATFLLRDTNTLASSVGAGHTINVEATNVNSATLNSGSSFTNAGTINLTSTGVFSTFLHLTDPGNGTLTNTGTLRFQSGGSGIRVFTGDLVNNGTVEVGQDTVFNKLNATYTNNGVIKISNGTALDITNSGNLTNQSGSTLTGGTFDINGTLRYPGANVQTNQAEIILRGAGSTIRNQDDLTDALEDLAVNGASGKLRLLEGRNFLRSGTTFTNHGVLELGGTTFTFFFAGGSTTFTNTATGQIVGAGRIDANFNVNLTNAGLVAPGTSTSAGILEFEGPYGQTATGDLAIGISGTNNSDPQNPQFDVLRIIGSAALDGTLAVDLFGGFTPASSDTITILDAFSLSGTFANVANGERLTTLGGEGSFQVNYNLGNVVLSDFLSAAGLPGDYNFDGTVDAADYVVWRKTIGTPAGYDVWRTNFGRTLGAGGGSAGASPSEGAVPEPASLGLLVVGILLLMASYRK